MIKTIAAGLFLGMLSICSAAIAQENANIVGKWGGNYLAKGTAIGEVRVGVDLEVTAVEGGKVTGIARNYATTACSGEYKMVGKIEGNKLGMISTGPGGRTGDCKFGFRVEVEGDKMTGTIGNSELILTRK